MEYAKKEVAVVECWTTKHANAVVKEFDRFMILKSIDDDISPCYDVDTLWHQVILDTGFYYKYCMDKFGKIIPHYPQNSKDIVKRTQRFAKTLQLYESIFKTAPPTAIWDDTDKDDDDTPQHTTYVPSRIRMARHGCSKGMRC